MEAPVCDACSDRSSWAIDSAQPLLDATQDQPGWPSSLSPDLLDTWCVLVFQGVVDNGGFQYLFERNLPAGITYARVAEALRRVGASESAECLEKAVQLFSLEVPEQNPELRDKLMREARRDPTVRDGPIDLLGDRAIELSPFTYHQLGEHLRSKGLVPTKR